MLSFLAAALIVIFSTYVVFTLNNLSLEIKVKTDEIVCPEDISKNMALKDYKKSEEQQLNLMHCFC